MSARTKQLERSRRFRRLHGEKKAVSPVVATLILILIAVAAAAALYLWLVAWQGGVTKGIGSPGAQYTVSIGGSTSVYPFAQQAATWFEANNSDVIISVNQGGSGAGMAAVCSGQVDIGEASTFYGTGAQPDASPGAIETSYGCPQTVAVEVIAYDGVDIIVSNSNTHGLQNMTWDTAQAIYFDAATLSPGYSSYAGTNVYANGAYHMNLISAPVQPAQGTGYLWDQIPACAAADTKVCGTGPAESNDTTETPGTAVNAAGTSGLAGNSFTGVKGTPETQTITGTASYTVGALSPSYVSATALGAIVAADLTSLAGNTLVPGTISITSASFPAAGTATVGFSISVVDDMNTATPDTVTFDATYPMVTSYLTPVLVPNTASAAAGSGHSCGTDVCVNATTPFNTPCGFTVCASGTQAIDTYTRSDVSGTQQSFESRILAIGAPTFSASTSTPQTLGFTGCPTGDNQWDACNVVLPSKYAENGNPAVITGVSGDANGIGFASDGLAQASGLVTPINFQGYGQTVVVKIVGESNALAAIALAIEDHEGNVASYATAQAYVGWRPFLNVETSPPTGEVLRYLQWVMDPANNQAVAAATYEISVYASGLAGHVPVTPIP